MTNVRSDARSDAALLVALESGDRDALATHQTEDVAAICDRVAVIDQGSILFEGTPAGVAETARGRVWSSPRPVPGARLSWRTATGRYRVIADHVEDAEAAEPTIEDAYLLLVGERALGEEEAA